MENKVSANHKSHAKLHTELEKARRKAIIGGVYSHYKYPENTYKVINLGFIESTDDICVIYQAIYNQELIFVRPLNDWLEILEWNGEKVARFSRIK
jgi:hypothetical protein